MSDEVIMNDEILGHVKDFEELQKQMKAKKQALKKSIFYAKHPSLRVAKDEVKQDVKEPVQKPVPKPREREAEEFNYHIKASVEIKPEVKAEVKPEAKPEPKSEAKEEKPKAAAAQVAVPTVAVSGRWF